MACFSTNGAIDLGRCFLLRPDGTAVADVFKTPSDLVNLLVGNLFVFAGIILFVMLIFAGFQFSMKGPKGKDDAKGTIQAVVVGFLVMFSAYWIVRIIELLIGQQILL